MQHRPQCGDVLLHGVDRILGRRRARWPQRIDQPRQRNHPAPVGREHRQQEPLPAAGHADGHAVAEHPDRPEDLDPDGVCHLPTVRRVGPSGPARSAGGFRQRTQSPAA